MARKILRRCDICKRFHASYVVTDPQTGEKRVVCTDCWKAKFAGKVPTETEPGQKPPKGIVSLQ